jgi:hypothetical protein
LHSRFFAGVSITEIIAAIHGPAPSYPRWIEFLQPTSRDGKGRS